MKICPSCGRSFESGKYCKYCGTAVPDEAPATLAPDEKDVYNDTLKVHRPFEFTPENGAVPGDGNTPFVPQSPSPMGYNDFDHVVTKNQNVSDSDKKKKTFVIILVSVLLGAALIIALTVGGVIFAVNAILDKDDSSDSSEETTVSEQQDYDSDAEAPVEKATYANVTDKAGTLDDSQLQNIQSRIENKISLTGVNIKILVVKDSKVVPQDYAKANCKSECGSDGIYMVMNTSGRVGGVATCGNGSKLLPDALKEAILESIMGNLKADDPYNACIDAVELIPDSIKDASLYSFKKVPGSQQVVYADSKNGTVTLVDWSGSKPDQLFKTDSVVFGMDGLTDTPSEYISATPRGTFKLGFAFSTYDLNTGLSTRTVTSRTVWVNDVDSAYYNTMQTGPTVNNPYWDSAESTYSYFTDGIYYACILIEHNGDGYTKGARAKGSAIFLSGKSSKFGTSYGDVNITSSDMKSLLSKLDESKNPYIVIT